MIIIHKTERFGEQLGDVNEPYVYVMFSAVSGDVKSAAAFIYDDGVGAGVGDAFDFVGNKGLADLGHFDGEGAAESAALVHFFQRYVFYAVDEPDQIDGCLRFEIEVPVVAGVMSGYFAAAFGIIF